MKKLLLILFLFLFLIWWVDANSIPALHFSDIVSWPKNWNSDTINWLDTSKHWSVVTIWWNNLGLWWNNSKVYIKGSNNIAYEAANIYYWKNADGKLPWWPADLYSTQKMQEISFSIPSLLANWNADIYVEVDGVVSNTLPFLVRSWNIYFIDDAWNDSSWDWSFSSPWKTVNYVANPWNNKLVAWDIVYLLNFTSNYSLKIWGKDPNSYKWTETHPYSLVSYPGNYDNYVSNVPNPTASNRNVNYASAIKNHWGKNDFWIFSKISIETNISWMWSFHKMRVVWLKFIWPYAEWTGWAIAWWWYEWWGVKVYWNYITNFGNSWTSNLHHIFYISNRTTTPTLAYELWWNHLKNNWAPGGLHIFDQYGQGWNCWRWDRDRTWDIPAWPWSWIWKFSVHDNVVHNQRWCGFDYSGWCARMWDFSSDLDLYNNIFINDPDSDFTGSPICLNANYLVWTVSVFNNLIYWYWSNKKDSSLALSISNQFSWVWKIYNNIFVDRSGQKNYLNYVKPDFFKNNLLFSTVNPFLPLPSWVWTTLNLSNNFEWNPNFENANIHDFRLKLWSIWIDSWFNIWSLDAYWVQKPIWIAHDIGPLESPPVSCTKNSDCSDGLYCNGIESCQNNLCIWGNSPVWNDDWISCTLNSCNENTDSFDITLNDNLCDDKNSSTIDTCSLISWCKYTLSWSIPTEGWTTPVIPDNNKITQYYQVIDDVHIDYTSYLWNGDKAQISIKQWAYFRFDLNGFIIPIDSEYLSAKLKLYTTAQYSNTLPLYVFTVDKAWLEWKNDTSWVTRDIYAQWKTWDNYMWDWLDKDWVINGFNYYDFTELYDDDTAKFIDIDLTNVIKEYIEWNSTILDNWIFLNPFLSNDTLVRKSVNAPSHVFYSKEYPDTTKHPVLEVTFIKKEPTPVPVPTPIPTPVPTPKPTPVPTLTPVPVPNPTPTTPTNWWWWWGWWGWGWWSFIKTCTQDQLECKLVPWSINTFKIYSKFWESCTSKERWNICNPEEFNKENIEINSVNTWFTNSWTANAWITITQEEKYISEVVIINKVAKKLDRIIIKRWKEVTWNLLTFRNNLLIQLEIYVWISKEKKPATYKKLKKKIIKRNVIKVYKKFLKELKR